MAYFFSYARSFVQDDRILLFITLFAIAFKGYLLVYFYSKWPLSQKTVYSRRILGLALLCSMIIEAAWIIAFCRRISLMELPFFLDYNLTRLSWLSYFTYCQAISYFILHLTQKKIQTSVKTYIHFIPSLILSGLYVLCMLYHYQSLRTAPYIYNLRLLAKLYNCFILIIPSIICATKRSQHKNFPRILALQVRWALLAFVIPFVTIELFVSFARYVIAVDRSMFNLLNTISTLLFTIGVYVGGRRISRLRFLNLQNKVTSAPRATFVTEMKNISDDLNATVSTSELPYIIKRFFCDAFGIPINRTHFYLIDDASEPTETFNSGKRISTIGQFLVENNAEATQLLQHHEILIMDELAFSNFYEHNSLQEKCIMLLEDINADLLIPIFKKDTVVACIVVDRHARKDQLYSNVESDEMVVFTNTIGNIVNILQNKDLEIVAQKEHDIRQQLHAEKQQLRGEVYHKQQEMNQYKEALRTFLYGAQHSEMGIIFYKNRRFSFVNQIANTIVDINLNNYPGHPVVKVITRMVREVEQFRTPQSCIITNAKHKQFVVSAIPNAEQTGAILLLQPPGISDLIKHNIDLLKDPHYWNYLLYLETTKAGKRINELIPGYSVPILNFKVHLLTSALAKQASLVVAAEDDIALLAPLLHEISMRSHMRVMTVHTPDTGLDTSLKLFGINKLLYPQKYTPPLLEKLDTSGALHIEGVHNLTLDTQKRLADYIQYGYFTPLYSNEKIVSDVRIICSTNQDLQPLVHNKLFDACLYKVLRETAIIMPSFTTCDSDELKEIIEDIASDTLKGTELENIISLSEADKMRIINNRPVSFITLRDTIKTKLTRKAENSPIAYSSNVDGTDDNDPLISHALKLGKKALRDDKIMRALWDKFKSQAKIATLLGVNRSSVSRRCHKLQIIPNENPFSKSVN